MIQTKVTSTNISELINSYFPNISREDIACFLEICHHKYCKNKEILVKPESKTRTFSFIISGVIRGYLIDKKGEEKNFFLRPEGSFVGSPNHLISNNPSKYTFESVLESEILLFDMEDFEKLTIDRPALFQILIWGLKNTLQTVIYRIESMIENLPEERYKDLLNKSPIFFQKVFNKHIANYLGITPVSLSRIIKRAKEAPHN